MTNTQLVLLALAFAGLVFLARRHVAKRRDQSGPYGGGGNSRDQGKHRPK